MECVKCGKYLSIFSNIVIEITKEKRACYDCFFEGIPNTHSKMQPDYAEVTAARKAAIEKRTIEFSKL